MIEARPPLQSVNARFIRHLEAGGAVLTATRRQAQLIRRLFDEAQLSAGRRSWATADVMPFTAWTAARWQEVARADSGLPILLDDAQAIWPWRRLAGSHTDAALLDAFDLAGAARRAWIALKRHGGTLDLLDRYALTSDQRQFLGWARAVESRLGEARWLDPGQLEAALAGQVSKLAPRGGLLLAGVDERRPRTMDLLLETLVVAGWSVEIAPPGERAGRGFRYPAADPAEEALAIVAWARRKLEGNPRARLGIIVSDLQARRAELERRFAAALQPELELPGSLERDRLFDFAGGPPLAAQSIVEAALDCLQAGDPRIPQDCLSRILRCRHVTQGGEDGARTRLDIQLRRQALPHWPVQSVVRLASQAGCPGLATAIEAVHRTLRTAGGIAPTDRWAEVFGEALRIWGWPGTGPLASDEYQVAQELRERLDRLAAMSRSAPLLSLSEARGEFARLLAAPFQPERGDAAIMVFDSLEPPGIEFDGLWVAGMSAAAWPRAAVQDPFLPVSLQDQLGIQGVTAQRCLAEARAITDAWLTTAREVTFSWPQRQDDAMVEPSRVLPASLETGVELPAPALREDLTFDAGGLEAMPADPAPALAAGESGGGSSILDLQAKCPFRAFAEIRLGAAPLEEPTGGIDRRARGNVLHRALELIWQTLGGQAGLGAATADSVAELVERSLERALREKVPADAGRRALSLEAEWQRLALEGLLELERTRPPFTVAGLEQTRDATLAGLHLKLRVDRLDRVEDGLLIIDYKTGRAGTSQWRGARMDAPQLPLYAVLHGRDVAAIAFTVVDARSAQFRGVGQGGNLPAGISEATRFSLTEDKQSGFSWQEICERWSGWLASLASDYVAGKAVVDPKQPQTCQFCHLSTLCRVEAELEVEAEEADDA
jgi:ATP-dependent helicase/nuclease subunit B